MDSIFESKTMERSLGRVAVAGIALGLLVFSEQATAGGISVGISLRGAPVWVPPVYETRARTIVDEAIYEVRPRRIWREPVYEERQIRVEIPAEVRMRREPRYDRHGHIVGYRLVEEVVRPARDVYKTERVLTRPGYYEVVEERVLVRPERTRTVYEEVLIEPGHWVYPRYTVSRGGRVYRSTVHSHR